MFSSFAVSTFSTELSASCGYQAHYYESENAYGPPMDCKTNADDVARDRPVQNFQSNGCTIIVDKMTCKKMGNDALNASDFVNTFDTTLRFPETSSRIRSRILVASTTSYAQNGTQGMDRVNLEDQTIHTFSNNSYLTAAYDATGHNAIAVSAAGFLQHSDFADNANLDDLSSHTVKVLSNAKHLSFAPAAKIFAATSFVESGTAKIMLLNATNLEELARLSLTGTAPPTSLVTSGTGDIIAVSKGSEVTLIKVSESEEGTISMTIDNQTVSSPENDATPALLAASRNIQSNLIAIVNSKTVRVIDASTQELQWSGTVDGNGLLTCAAVSFGGLKLATGTSTGKVYVWDMEDGSQELLQLEEVASLHVKSLTFTADGSELAIFCDTTNAAASETFAKLVVWHLDDKEVTYTLNMIFKCIVRRKQHGERAQRISIDLDKFSQQWPLKEQWRSMVITTDTMPSGGKMIFTFDREVFVGDLSNSKVSLYVARQTSSPEAMKLPQRFEKIVFHDRETCSALVKEYVVDGTKIKLMNVDGTMPAAGTICCKGHTFEFTFAESSDELTVTTNKDAAATTLTAGSVVFTKKEAHTIKKGEIFRDGWHDFTVGDNVLYPCPFTNTMYMSTINSITDDACKLTTDVNTTDKINADPFLKFNHDLSNVKDSVPLSAVRWRTVAEGGEKYAKCYVSSKELQYSMKESGETASLNPCFGATTNLARPISKTDAKLPVRGISVPIEAANENDSFTYRDDPACQLPYTWSTVPISDANVNDQILEPEIAVKMYEFLNATEDFGHLQGTETTLRSSMHPFDRIMYVTDANKLRLGQAGLVKVDDELIFYTRRDLANDALVELRRGLLGTYAAKHAVDSKVTFLSQGVLSYLYMHHERARKIGQIWGTFEGRASYATHVERVYFAATSAIAGSHFEVQSKVGQKLDSTEDYLKALEHIEGSRNGHDHGI